jgi:hypothetical protein
VDVGVSIDGVWSPASSRAMAWRLIASFAAAAR